MSEVGGTYLWVDGNLNDGYAQQYGGDLVLTASSCAAALRAMIDGPEFDGIIINPLVPQGEWGDRSLERPGVEFANSLPGLSGQRVAFLVDGVPGRQRGVAVLDALDSGTVGVFDVRTTTIEGVLEAFKLAALERKAA